MVESSAKKWAATLKDVALRAGVSTATVSRCLNEPKHVADLTRHKVMQAVSDLGYSPNFGARVMAARRTNTVGAIIPTMENAIFARGLQAFQEQLRDQGYTLLVACSSYSSELEEEQIRALVARGADGLLLVGYERNPEIYAFLQRQNVPTLVTWAYESSAAQPAIGFDNRAAMRALAREVIKLGHTRLGAISAQILHNDRARLRLLGIHDAMKEAGLNPDDLSVIETHYDINCGAQAFETLYTPPVGTPRPSAILCANDVLAIGALKRARAMGVRVPEDVSITGFDDIELAQVADPALTTVHVPHREMGQAAALCLVHMLRGEAAPRHAQELMTELRLRESLARPAR